MIGHRNEVDTSSSVSPEISVIDVDEHNIHQLQQLHSVLFPIRYPEKFYKAYVEGLYRLGNIRNDNLSIYCHLQSNIRVRLSVVFVVDLKFQQMEI